MRGTAEAEEAETTRVAGHAEGAIADEPRTEQRRRLPIVEIAGEAEDVAGVGDGVRGIAAVDAGSP